MFLMVEYSLSGITAWSRREPSGTYLKNKVRQDGILGHPFFLVMSPSQ